MSAHISLNRHNIKERHTTDNHNIGKKKHMFPSCVKGLLTEKRFMCQNVCPVADNHTYIQAKQWNRCPFQEFQDLLLSAYNQGVVQWYPIMWYTVGVMWSCSLSYSLLLIRYRSNTQVIIRICFVNGLSKVWCFRVSLLHVVLAD